MVVIFTITAGIAFLASAAFVVRFHVTTGGDWRRTRMGRHVMAFMAVICGLLAFTVARVLFGDYPGRQVLLAAGFVLFAAVLVQRVVLLEREQRPTRRGRPGPPRMAAPPPPSDPLDEERP